MSSELDRRDLGMSISSKSRLYLWTFRSIISQSFKKCRLCTVPAQRSTAVRICGIDSHIVGILGLIQHALVQVISGQIRLLVIFFHLIVECVVFHLLVRFHHIDPLFVVVAEPFQLNRKFCYFEMSTRRKSNSSPDTNLQSRRPLLIVHRNFVQAIVANFSNFLVLVVHQVDQIRRRFRFLDHVVSGAFVAQYLLEHEHDLQNHFVVLLLRLQQFDQRRYHFRFAQKHRARLVAGTSSQEYNGVQYNIVG